jgi:hypothetical protein
MMSVTRTGSFSFLLTAPEGNTLAVRAPANHEAIGLVGLWHVPLLAEIGASMKRRKPPDLPALHIPFAKRLHHLESTWMGVVTKQRTLNDKTTLTHEHETYSHSLCRGAGIGQHDGTSEVTSAI